MYFLPEFSKETWILLILLLALLTYYGIWPYRLFKKYGIPGPKPLPFIGTFLENRNGIAEFDMECFKKYGKVWGSYDGRQPVLSIMDPVIIKAILVKECYSIFTNRRNFGLNGPLNSAVSTATDDQWKRIRTVLSPTFTSGKLKQMFPVIKHYGDLLVKNIQKKVDNKEFIHMKDIFGSYSMDIVLSTSFSVNVDSLNNPQDPFVTNGKKLFSFSFFNPLFLTTVLCPFLIPILDKLNFCFLPMSVLNFFQDAIKNIKKDRQKGGHMDRVDFLQLMIDSQGENGSLSAKDHGYRALTDTEIMAQGLIFIMAGYETTSTTLMFLAYHLATNPDVQTKLQEEIDTYLPNKAPPTYEILNQMEYLDMVIYESLRLYPAAGRIERVCKKTTEINGVTIPKGVVIVIPAYVLHRDPSLWPDPEEFRPERFSKENRDTQDPYTFLPFGAGPRNCIGMRFAMINMKSAITMLLQNFNFRTCKETPVPLQIDTKGFLKTTKPVILSLVPRDTEEGKPLNCREPEVQEERTNNINKKRNKKGKVFTRESPTPKEEIMYFIPEFSKETWILLIVLLALLAYYGIWPYQLFKRYGIPGPRPLPFIGTFLENKNGLFEFDSACFKKYGKIWGFYDGRQPVLAIMDPAIIKTILVKECFTLFTNRRNFGLNGPLNNSVLIAEDDKWKRIRTVLTPTFTSGKLKQMFPIVKHYGELLVKNIQKKVENNEYIHMKEIFGSYSMDIVLSTSFSVNVDSMNSPNDPFVTNARNLFNFSFFNPLFLLTVLCPFLIPILNKMNFCFLPLNILNFFQDAIKSIKKDRQKGNHTDRVDFLQLMVDSQTESEIPSGEENHGYKALTDSEIMAQGLIFIMAGYETTSTTLMFLAYHLATHPDVQTKLQEEIDTYLPNKATPTYDILNQMDYLDMVINETLRLYPSSLRLERVCKKTTEINGVTIPKGVVTVIPVFVLHRDPTYWPDPEEFRPERFSKDNKDTQDPYTFLPFGIGPRNCIGMRFAMVNMKSVITMLLQNFIFKTCKDTPIPLQVDTIGYLKTTKPVILNLVPRESQKTEN
ncbi:uncharacterized protein PAF06_003303 [Gastrophryne carolinensis]